MHAEPQEVHETHEARRHPVRFCRRCPLTYVDEFSHTISNTNASGGTVASVCREWEAITIRINKTVKIIHIVTGCARRIRPMRRGRNKAERPNDNIGILSRATELKRSCHVNTIDGNVTHFQQVIF